MSAVVRIQLPQFSLGLKAARKDQCLVTRLTPDVALGKFHRLHREASIRGFI